MLLATLAAGVPEAALAGATHLCSDDPVFGRLLLGRYLNVLWDDILPPSGVSRIAASTAPTSAVPEEERLSTYAAWSAEDPHGFGQSVAQMLADLRAETKAGVDAMAAADVAAAFSADITAAEAVEATHGGPIRFVLGEVLRAGEAVTGIRSKAVAALARTIEFGATTMDLLRRRTSLLELLLDGVAHLDRKFLAAHPFTFWELLTYVRMEATAVAMRHVADSALTLVCFRIGQRQLFGRVAELRAGAGGPDAWGLPKAELMSLHLLMGAVSFASAADLDAFHFRNLWMSRLIWWLRAKLRRAPLVLVPGAVKRALGLGSASTPFPRGRGGSGTATEEAFEWHNACLRESVWRATLHRNLIPLLRAAAEEQSVWLHGYWRAARANASSFVWATVFKYHVLSSATLALHVGGSLAIRTAAAAVGFRLLPGSWGGAYWLEAAAHYALQRYAKRAVLRAADALALLWDTHWGIGAPFGQIDPDDLLEQAERERARRRREHRAAADNAGGDIPEHQRQTQPSDDEDGTGGGRRRSAEANFDQQTLEEVCTTEDYYALLGVPADAPAEDLRRAYRRQALRVHPDKVAHLPPAQQAEATAQFKALSRAHAVLSDPRKRREYDGYRGCRSAMGLNGAGGAKTAREQELEQLFAMMPPALRGTIVTRAIASLVGAPLAVQFAVASGIAYGTLCLGATLGEGHWYAMLRKTTALGVIM